jgi:hypothetical protein
MSEGMMHGKYTPPWGGMMAHWKFDDDVNDALGVFNGIPNGTPTYAAGISNNAIVLNGTSQDMQLSHANALIMGTWTVSAWVKLDNNASGRTNGIIGSRFGGENTFDFKIDTNNGRLHADIGDGTVWFTSAADQAYAFTPGVWYMVTMAVGEGRWDYYVNGNIVGAGGTLAGVPVFTLPTRTIHIGNSFGTEYFSGSLDEMYLFARVLRANEIAALYNAILVP